MKKVDFIRFNMLLNLQLDPEEARAYAQYADDCRKLGDKMRGEAEAYGLVTPVKIDDTKIKMPYPLFYENKTILPYLDLTQKDKVIGMKVRHLVLYKNSLKSNFRDVKQKLADMSEHFGFYLECPSDADLLTFYLERRNINAAAVLLRQYDIDFTALEGLYWYRNSPIDKIAKAFDMSNQERQFNVTREIAVKTKLRPLICAEKISL